MVKRDYLYSAFAKFSEKLTFLNLIRTGVRNVSFSKNFAYEPNKWSETKSYCWIMSTNKAEIFEQTIHKLIPGILDVFQAKDNELNKVLICLMLNHSIKRRKHQSFVAKFMDETWTFFRYKLCQKKCF